MMRAEELTALAKRLRVYNDWRRGYELLEQPDPAAVGHDIEDAIEVIEAEVCRIRMGDEKA